MLTRCRSRASASSMPSALAACVAAAIRALASLVARVCSSSLSCAGQRQHACGCVWWHGIAARLSTYAAECSLRTGGAIATHKSDRRTLWFSIASRACSSSTWCWSRCKLWSSQPQHERPLPFQAFERTGFTCSVQGKDKAQVFVEIIFVLDTYLPTIRCMACICDESSFSRSRLSSTSR
jgi:hypothetical protein